MSDLADVEHSPQDDRPPRNRLRLGFTITIWLVLLAVVVAIFSPLRDVALNHIFPPSITPTATVTAGDNQFYIQASPQGNITIDGRPVTQLPAVGTGVPIQLSRGQHKIAWQAEPFAPLSCIVSVPSSITNDQCNYESNFPLSSGTNVRLISFFATLSSLSDNQRNALTHSMQATLNALQSTTIVQPGEPYYDSQSTQPNSLVTATQPLKATLSFHLDLNPNSPQACYNFQQTVCTINGQNCLQLCSIPAPVTSSVTPSTEPVTPTPPTSPSPATIQPAWNILALYYPTWTYTTLNGQPVGQSQHDPFVYPATLPGSDYSIYLHAAWNGTSWHTSILSHTPPYGSVSLLYGNTQLPAAIDPSCASLDNGIVGPYSLIPGSQAENANWTFYTAPNRVDGCLGVVKPDGTPNAHPAYFLYRFGAILAVNTLAHSYFPTLPVADSNAQGIAGQIIATNKL